MRGRAAGAEAGDSLAVPPMRTGRHADAVRLAIVVAIVAAILVVVFAAGWADDKARPGTSGRAPVSAPVTTSTP